MRDVIKLLGHSAQQHIPMIETCLLERIDLFKEVFNNVEFACKFSE